MGYLRKEPDSSLLYTVVNQQEPDAEGLFSQCQLFKHLSNIHYISIIVLNVLQKRRLIKWT